MNIIIVNCLTFFKKKLPGISYSSADNDLLTSKHGRDEGYAKKTPDGESCSLEKSKELMKMKLSSFLDSFHNIQSQVRSFIREQMLLKTEIDNLSEGRTIKL